VLLFAGSLHGACFFPNRGITPEVDNPLKPSTIFTKDDPIRFIVVAEN
jgi:hypothetical protein